MDTVQEFAEHFKEIGEDKFLSKFNQPFLLYPEKQGAKAFSTHHTQMSGRDSGINIAGSETELQRFHVLPCRSSQETNTEKRNFLIGRGEDRHFSIDHSTVSKRHAFILFNTSNQTYQLGDAGSTNGTFLDGQTVEAGEPVFIRDGSVVSFGDCDYLFFSSKGFSELLKRLNQ
jgi:hypothetical protein